MSAFDLDYYREIFSEFGEVTFRKMFGGLSIYHKGLIFAIVHQDEVLLKADKVLGEIWMNESCKQWVYTHKNTGKITAMPYYSIPEECLEDPSVMAIRAKQAYKTALKLN
jgi:DNA transformation protein and related proteins